MASESKKYTLVKPGERIDHISVRVYGHAGGVRRLIRANPQLNIWQPQSGQKIEVPRA